MLKSKTFTAICAAVSWFIEAIGPPRWSLRAWRWHTGTTRSSGNSSSVGGGWGGATLIIYLPPQAKLIFPGVSGGLQADWQFSLLAKNKDPGQTTRTVSTLLTSYFTQSRRWQCHSHSARACVENRRSRVRPSSASSSSPSDPVSQEPPTAQHLSCVSPSHADSLGQQTGWIRVGSETNENKIRKSRSGSFLTAGKSLFFSMKTCFSTLT